MKKLFHYLFSRMIFQKLWQVLFYLSIKGMNYGYSDSPASSGEKWVISKLIKNKNLEKDQSINLVNVGANNGQYCDLFINQMGSLFYKCHIYLFEPQERCIEILKNKYKKLPNIHVYGIGLGEKENEKLLYRETLGSVQASFIKNPTLKNEMKTVVNISTLDIFCKEQSIEHLDLSLIHI